MVEKKETELKPACPLYDLLFHLPLPPPMSLKYSIQQDQHNLLPKHRIRRNHPYVSGCWSTAIRGIAFRHREPVSPPDNYKAKNDRYDILAVLESIGTGAYAQVRLGVGSDYNLYAIKTFRPRSKKVSHRSFLKAISSEYCIAATMDHPNIIKTLDFSIDQSGHYFTTMEYVSAFHLYFPKVCVCVNPPTGCLSYFCMHLCYSVQMKTCAVRLRMGV